MSIRCALGVHEWKPIVRHCKYARRNLYPVIMPFGFDLRYMGMIDAGWTNWETIGRKCKRCGLRRHKGE